MGTSSAGDTEVKGDFDNDCGAGVCGSDSGDGVACEQGIEIQPAAVGAKEKETGFEVVGAVGCVAGCVAG